MNTWSLFSQQKVTPPSQVDGIPFKQLWYNSYVTQNSNIITDTVNNSLYHQARRLGGGGLLGLLITDPRDHDNVKIKKSLTNLVINSTLKLPHMSIIN